MLKTRTVIILVAIVVFISLIGIIVELSGPPPGAESGRSSWGIRPWGHRAVFALMKRLDRPVTRTRLPDARVLADNPVLVLWAPKNWQAASQPRFLRDARRWVEQGGILVISPAPWQRPANQLERWAQTQNPDSTALVELGLSDVHVKLVGEIEKETAWRTPLGASSEKEAWAFGLAPPAAETVTVDAAGSLAPVAVAQELSVPAKGFYAIEYTGSQEPAGTVHIRHSTGERSLVAAEFALGKGRLLVVSDPDLFGNAYLGRADNSVLAAHLLGRYRRPLVFDEFYHGLNVQGNPFWLLSLPRYGLLALTLLLTSVMWVWRAAVRLGPPLEGDRADRRDLREYIEAMARLFNRPKHRPFVLNHLRDGILWSLSKELRTDPCLPGEKGIAFALERKDPERAQQLRDALDLVAKIPSTRKKMSEKEYLHLSRKLDQCLSRN